MPRLRSTLALILLLVFGAGSLRASTPTQPSAEHTRRLLEQAIEFALEDGYLSAEDAEEAYAAVDGWLATPRNVNEITADELAEYRLLTPYQIYQFVHYRAEHSGRIASLYDLKTIPGWDEATALALAPLLAEGNAPDRPWREGVERGRLEAALLHTRLASRADKDYLGPPNSFALRGQYTAPDRLSVFVGAERDAYEPWRYGGRVGFDSYTAQVSVEHLGALRRLVLGDYRASWGEGLMLSQGFRLRPPYQPTTCRGLRPMQSLAEGERSRGIAAELERGAWQLSLVYSAQYLDGRVDDDGVITGLSETGLHRTEGELERRRAVPMSLFGGQLAYATDRLGIAVGALHQSFAPNMLAHATGASGVAALDSLSVQSLFSVSYQWMSRSGAVRLSGEAARTSVGGWAWAQQLRVSGGRLGDWSLALRHISPTYWAYSGRTYTHTLRPNDEQGASLFVESRELLLGWRLTAGVDAYRHVSEPSQGIGLALRTTAECGDRSGGHWRASASYRRPIDGVPALRLSLQRRWASGVWSVTPYIALSRTVGQWSGAVALRGELRTNDRLRFWGLLALYRATWRGRLYLPEQRLRYQYGFTMVHGSGVRLSAGGLWQVMSRAALGLTAVYAPRSEGVARSDSQISVAFYLK